MKNPVYLRIYYKKELVEVKQFDQDQIVIGRAETAQVVLSNESISTLHAVIDRRDSGYYISDLGSKEGVFKNQDKILDAKLETGDEIRLGDYVIEFSLAPKKPDQSPPKRSPDPEKPADPNVAKAIVTGIEKHEATSDEEDTEELDQKITDLDTKPSDGLIEKDTMPGSGLIEKDTMPASGLIEKDTMPASGLIEKDTMPGGESENIDDSLTPFNDGSQSDSLKSDGASEDQSSRLVMIGDEENVSEKTNELKHSFKPGSGFNVQISVAWQDKIISTQTYNEKKDIYMGPSPKNEVVVPLLGMSKSKHLLIKMDEEVKIFISPEMSGEVMAGNKSYSFAQLTKQGRVFKSPKGPFISLQLNEVVRIGLQGELLSVYIRFNEETPKVIGGPLLDLTMSELTSVVSVFVIAAVFGLYMYLYAPVPKDELLIEEPIRKARVKFNRPNQPRKKISEVTKVETKTKIPKEVKPKDKDPGKSKKVMESKKQAEKKDKKRKKLTSIKKGGSKKTSSKKGANMKSVKKDPADLGLLAAFGKKGVNKKMNKSFSGKGELAGLADKSTGSSGMNEYRPGNDLGTKLKATGSTGKGTSIKGISDVKTGGVGSGVEGLGKGSVGKRAKVDFKLGGQEEAFIGKIDKEAVRRVIKANINSIKYCYERQLRLDSGLYGTLSLQWVITDGGVAERFTVKKNTLGNKKVASCVISRLKGLKFPEPPQDTEATVIYPFSFSSQSQ